jgi:exopolyphosphatase/guanosine-5'-triphosphate,3'-diphosphate pyrophosphatase
MNRVKPRWEWRSFGRCFGEAVSRLARLTPGGVQESDELYLLSGAGDNVKVRDVLMDIKVLPEEAFQAGVEFRAYLANCGIPLVASDETKTKAAMEYFKKKLES